MLHLGLVRRGNRAPRRDVAVVAALLFTSLLACKSQHSVDGTITVNGAPFVAKQCVVGSLTMNGVTTHSVTLTDATDNRLSFSDSNGVTVSFTPAGGSMENGGTGCGVARFSGSVKDPHTLKVQLDVSCRGGGYATVAKADVTKCGTFGL
ncbi:MAG: hypothetical protein KC776_15330 [Myxococcales bacterium]|nr:hypothetical protein [Myxococcales bacterium]MCB9581366.1 hypothetical protein [Polyangiaceae bacterium]